MVGKYNITMFAYNEEKNIARSVSSVFANVDASLGYLTVIANGCSDNTVTVLNELKQKQGLEKLRIVDLELGDKCNAWNHYTHNLADDADVHFFVDADVCFSQNSFTQLAQTLLQTPDETVAVAGMPLSGRNLDFYRELIVERSCFFGNLYGLKRQFLERVREDSFRLPIGLNWIDSFLTKAVNTDLKFFNYNLPNRVTYKNNVGYEFDSLSVFKLSDINLYINRIARYELGKIQEIYLEQLSVQDWPADMYEINCKIEQNFVSDTAHLGKVKRYLVRKRLAKLLKKARPNTGVLKSASAQNR
ncbi:glycosyltransferase [Alteromonas aestuariivivens]|uniref:Glycosyltransferase n=1 Tax=Alteromonas aestuariivivens TaxID=1938339 RepID=A0A3D8MEZ5_9ALTE|nr:glycosyltransferase [Alteromonas aestuariivivens]RDV29196.1 glycosyltransferase [Alteromonas aestuariivivens]